MRRGDALVTPRSDATFRPKRRPARVDDLSPALGKSLPGVAPALHIIVSPIAGGRLLLRMINRVPQWFGICPTVTAFSGNRDVALTNSQRVVQRRIVGCFGVVLSPEPPFRFE
jgi:hypothetical protein